MSESSLGRNDSWNGVRAVVVGFDSDGQAAADNLLHLGADVTVIDPEARWETKEFSDLLGVLGAKFRRDHPGTGEWDLVIATGAASAVTALSEVRASHAHVRVLSALDLARQLEPDQTWLLVGTPEGSYVAGTQAHQIAQGTVAMLRAGGVAAAVADGSQRSVIELVMEPEPYEVLVVVASPALMAVSGALRPHSACVLTGVDGLGAVFTDVEVAAIYKPEDARTEDMVRGADVTEGARAIGITLGTPGLSMLGVVEDVLCDRAFVEDRRSSAAEICTLGELRASDDSAVEAVLASVALARAYGVALAPIRHAISETF